MTHQQYLDRLSAIGMLPEPAVPQRGFFLISINWDLFWVYDDKNREPRTQQEAPWHVEPGKEEQWAKEQGPRRASWFVAADVK